MGKINKFCEKLVCLPIIFYRLIISPVIGSHCRFYPSCSQYALTSIRHYGILKGLKQTCFRLLRCHPWSAGGYDPVLPDKEKL